MLPLDDVFFDTIMIADEFCDDDLQLYQDSFEDQLDDASIEPAIDASTLMVAATTFNLHKFMAFSPTIDWILHVQTICVFWITVIFWDSVLYWFEAPQCSLMARRIRRSRRPPTISSFPSSWLILSHCILLLPTFYSGRRNADTFPIPSLAKLMAYSVQRTNSTYHRVEQLDRLVHLNHETWGQLNTLYWNQLQTSVTAKWITKAQNTAKDEWCVPDQDSDLFFDSYEYPSLPVDQIYFFDALLDQQVEILDILSIHDICQPRGIVDCCGNVTDGDLNVRPSLSSSACLYLTTTQDQVNPGFNSNPFFSFGTTRHAVIFDTGASLGITHDIHDFDGPLTVPEGELRLGGMAQGLLIEGIGPVTWTFRNSDGSEVEIRSNCYYVPNSKVRLISPQRLFNAAKGIRGKFEGNEQAFHLAFDNCRILTLEYDERNHLPIGYASIGSKTSMRPINPQANLLLTSSDENQNLTAGQKLLLHWHYRFGHLNLPRVQHVLRNFPFQALKFTAASKCDVSNLKCDICQYAKNHRKPTQGSQSTPNEDPWEL